MLLIFSFFLLIFFCILALKFSFEVIYLLQKNNYDGLKFFRTIWYELNNFFYFLYIN
jgi:hypothetical protein